MKQEKEKKWTNAETDSTIRLIGGLGIFGIFMLLLFAGDWWFGKQLMTEAVVHSILTFCAGWVAGNARAQLQNQNGYGYPPQPPRQQRKGRLQ